jgi:hypothetical protein
LYDAGSERAQLDVPKHVAARLLHASSEVLGEVLRPAGEAEPLRFPNEFEVVGVFRHFDAVDPVGQRDEIDQLAIASKAGEGRGALFEDATLLGW